MRFRQGFFVVNLSGGVPVMIHWTTLAMGALASGFSFQPGTWLAVFVVILLHEVGHAAAVWSAHATVTAIRMDGTGGHCEWTGTVSRKQHLAIVWGGVLTQFLLWAIVAVSALFIHPPISSFTLQLLKTFLGWNLFIIALNLLPIAPLDGHQAWRLLWHVWQDWRHNHKREIAHNQPPPMPEILTRRTPVAAAKSEIQIVVDEVLARAAAEHKAKKQIIETKKITES